MPNYCSYRKNELEGPPVRLGADAVAVATVGGAGPIADPHHMFGNTREKSETYIVVNTVF